MKTIKEVIIVEGSHDEAVVKRALAADTIATHGFGIKEETWKLIEKAYLTRGIIILTDPDFAGNTIRKKLKERFPEAKEAFLSRKLATKNGDIGIENAEARHVSEALSKAGLTISEATKEFSFDDLLRHGLAESSEARQRRDKLGMSLGIGYGNASAFLKKLNAFGISRENFEREAERL